MRVWMIFWLLIAAAVAAFAAVNWSVLTAQTIVNLGWAEVSAPLGLMMLGTLALIAVIFLVFVVWLETRVLMQLRPVGITSGRETAGQDEIRRAEANESINALVSRLERLEQTMTRELEQTNLRLSAQVDRLDQGLKRAG